MTEPTMLSELVDVNQIDEVWENRKFVSKVNLIDEPHGTGLLVRLEGNPVPLLFNCDEKGLAQLANHIISGLAPNDD